MHRRTVLSTLGAGVVPLSGCIGPLGPEEESLETESSSTATDESDRLHTVSLTDHSDSELRETFDIAAQIVVLESSVTTEHTATVHIVLETTVEESRTLTYTRNRCNLNLIPGRSLSGDQLFLLSTDHQWERTEERCWMTDRARIICGIPAMDHEISIAPDEPIRWTFHLWAHPKSRKNDVCMSPGAYQFTRAFEYEKSTASLDFTLSIDPN